MISRRTTAPSTTTWTPTTTTLAPSMIEPAQNSTNERSNSQRRYRRTIDTSSAPSTPTGSRYLVEGYKPEIPILPVRVSSFGSDALSVCTPDYPDRPTVSTCSSFSSSVPNVESTSNPIRNVNLYDLIDEQFVVNCGSPRRNSNTNNNNPCTSQPGHRRKKSILDMIDGIASSDDDETSVMTTRSYPRGVYVVRPPNDRETTVPGNTVAFVSAEAYNQW